MQEKSPRLQAALAFAAVGIPVFPCLPDSKEPATEHGFQDATTDPAKIEAWWQEADYNVAFAPAMVGWSVIDPDGPEGEAAWAKLVQEHDIPETYTIRTPRGGHHYYFDGDLPMSTWMPGAKRVLGEHIDTRGTTMDGRPGAYVLIPPSTFEGKPYALENDTSLAPVPAFAVTALTPTYSRLETASGGADLAPSIDRARAFLADCVEHGDIAVEGRGGNNRTYQLACSLQNLGVGPEKAFDLITEIWNPSCVPPWEPDELATVIEHAYSYAQNALGAWAVEPLSQSFKDALDQLPKEPAAAARPNPFHLRDIDEQDQAPEPVWLVPKLLPDRSTVLVTGKSGDFKGFLMLDLALGIATGTLTFGSIPLRRGVVCYATNEGLLELGKLRRPAWLEHRGVEREASRNFFTTRCPRIVSEGEVALFKAALREEVLKTGPLAAIFIDTVTKAMAGLDEVSSKDVTVFTTFVDDLREEFQCPIVCVNHFGKTESTGGKGSSALPAGMDTLIEVHRIPETLAVELKVVQHKDAATPAEPWTFEGIPVGRSLVFDPTSAKQHKDYDHQDERFDQAKVASVLARLGAVGVENGVSSTVLATELSGSMEQRTEEEKLDTIKRNARSLEGLGRRKLSGYNFHSGRTYTWFIPASVAEGVSRALQESEEAKP